MALQKAKEIVNSDSVVVFSKTFCPYCVRVKELLQQLGAKFKAIELDTESFVHEPIIKFLCFLMNMWFYLPRVKEVSATSNLHCIVATSNLHKDGKLVPLLTEAGAIAGKTATTSA